MFDENGSNEIRTWDTRGKAVKPKTLDHLATRALKGFIFLAIIIHNHIKKIPDVKGIFMSTCRIALAFF
jgi:hypothetical protein